MTTATDTVDKKFPFQIEDLKAWIIRRKDGTLIKYTLIDSPVAGGTKLVAKGGTAPTPATKVSYGDWCKHDSPTLPTFSFSPAKGKTLELRIADAAGVRAAYAKCIEDLIIDAGDVLSQWASSPILTGTDKGLIDALSPYADDGLTSILKVKWDDRQAPDLHPQFWLDLADTLKTRAGEQDDNIPYRMLINCMGGHGRSGTGLVCLMMALSDYNALDAITHLRAVHCPRAIESVIQHEYIDLFAAYLGRTANANEAQRVNNFKERFLTLTCETSRPYRLRLAGPNKEMN